MIPEYVYTLSDVYRPSQSSCRGVETLVSSSATPAFATPYIGLSLVAGFIFMLFMESQISHAAHDAPQSGSQQPERTDVSSVEFDVELGELEREEGIPGQSSSRLASSHRNPVVETQRRALPLTLGLVVHALADGLALGSAALSEPGSQTETPAQSIVPSGLSVIVFFALAIHKGVSSDSRLCCHASGC